MINVKNIPKSRKEWGQEYSSVVEHLPSTLKALGSINSTNKKIKQEQKQNNQIKIK
jgi:hypothetical protein